MFLPHLQPQVVVNTFLGLDLPVKIMQTTYELGDDSQNLAMSHGNDPSSEYITPAPIVVYAEGIAECEET